jgi:hypothetical protein
VLAKVLTIAALFGLAFVAVILAVAKLQLRRVERLLAESERLSAVHITEKESRDQKFKADKADLDEASSELHAAVAEAWRLADHRIAETSNVFAKRRVLQDKLKVLEFQRASTDGAPKVSLVALAMEYRERAKAIRQFAKRF